MQCFGSNIVEGVAESWVEAEMSWVEMDRAGWWWMELGGDGWSWVEVDGARWRWMELGGVRWSWVEVGARFSNTPLLMSKSEEMLVRSVYKKTDEWYIK